MTHRILPKDSTSTAYGRVHADEASDAGSRTHDFCSQEFSAGDVQQYCLPIAYCRNCSLCVPAGDGGSPQGTPLSPHRPISGCQIRALTSLHLLERVKAAQVSWHVRRTNQTYVTLTLDSRCSLLLVTSCQLGYELLLPVPLPEDVLSAGLALHRPILKCSCQAGALTRVQINKTAI